MGLTEAQQEPGVYDLPKRARRFFAAAIHFERKGSYDKAETYLKKAIAAEERAS